MTPTAPANVRPAPRRNAGSERVGACGSRCRRSPAPILTTSLSGEPGIRRRTMWPLEGAADIRRIIELAEPVLPRLRPFSAAEFLSLELPPRGMVLDPLLPEKGLALLHAYRGIGKTHLALGIGFTIASGAEILGMQAPTPRRVLYLDGEMPANTMQARLAAVIAGFQAEPPDPSYFHILSADLTEGGLPDLATADGQAEIDASIARSSAEVVIVDNISTWVRSGRENEAEGWL